MIAKVIKTSARVKPKAALKNPKPRTSGGGESQHYAS